MREDLKEASQRIAELELRLDESHSKEAQARTNIKVRCCFSCFPALVLY